MWLLILSFSAVIATFLWYSKAEDDKYMLRLLSLILWGATIMVFTDHVLGYLMEGGEFLEMTADATVLGITLLIVAMIAWEIVLLLRDPKSVIYKKKQKNK